MRHHTGKLEVVVVGGGLAGLTAAALLARDGQRVALFERAETVGGRAVTHVKNGFHLNLGPHAWYTGGAGTAVLGNLGIPVGGHRPRPSGAFALCGDRLHTLPIGFISLMTTDLLALHGKLEVARLLATMPRMDPAVFRDLTIGAWLDEHVHDERARAVMNTVIRVASYTNAPRVLSADAALHAFQIVLRDNVQYLDGGWQSLVDALRAKARAFGARIHHGTAVAEVLHNGAVSGVRLDEGEMILAPNVVLAVPPEVARRLVPRTSPFATGWEATPSKAACLDLGLARLPKPGNTFAVGVDRPLYYSVHSAAAALAPRGGALIHVAKYLDPSEPADASSTERELETLIDRLQPGWRREVVVRRYLPSMTVSNAIPTPATGGLRGRAPVEVREIPGLFVAGDWVGGEGMLANASLASAAHASRLVTARARHAAGAVA